MTATITLTDAIDRIIEADRTGTSRIYVDAGTVCDGDPYTISEAGRVHIDYCTGAVSIDVLSPYHPDGFVTVGLGNANLLRTEAGEHGDHAMVVWIDIITRQPVHVDLLGVAFDAHEDDIQALIDQLIELEDSVAPVMVDDERISAIAALHIYWQLNS